MVVFGMTKIQVKDISFGAKAGLYLASLIADDVAEDANVSNSVIGISAGFFFLEDTHK